MLNFDYRGIRWGYTFLITDPRLTEEQRHDVMYRATSMYLLNGETRHDFKDDDLEYEGYIRTKGEFDSIGGLSGQRFDAELDTKYGRVNVRFLVSEQTTGSRTSISNN